MVRLEPVQANPTLSQFFLNSWVMMFKSCVVGSNVRENSALTPLFQIGGAAAVVCWVRRVTVREWCSSTVWDSTSLSSS